jgi:hypothetical protein
VSAFEKSGRPPAGERLEAIKQTLEAAGVEFTNSAPGVVMLKAKTTVRRATWDPPAER